MQSRPTEVPKTTSQAAICENPHDRQYGFDHHDEESPQPSPSGVGGLWSDEAPPRGTSSTRPIAESSTTVDTPPRRLSSEPLSKTRAHADRITEHEKALTPLPKNKARGPGFRVVSKPKRSGAVTTGLADFPNGVVETMLSYVP